MSTHDLRLLFSAIGFTFYLAHLFYHWKAVRSEERSARKERAGRAHELDA